MKPRLILFVDHAIAVGGAERCLLLLMTFLDRNRWQPHLIAPYGQLAEEAAGAGIPVHIQDLPRLRGSSRSLLDLWKQGLRISRTAREISAALIHSITVRATAYASLAARLASVPLVWHMGDFWLSEDEPAAKRVDRLGKSVFCSMASRVITMSHAVAEHLPCSNNASVLHNGIDLAHFDLAHNTAQNRANICKAAGFPAAAPIVGMVGRMRPWKGQETFLRMARQLSEQVPECRFLIVGGDPFGVQDDYEARLLALGSQPSLAARVHWTGQLADVRPPLAAMDLFVHPGAPEPFGLVNIEAMAMGKPVVAFGHGALPEIVLHEETGLLAQPGDTAALTASVTRLLKAPALSRSMGRAGRRRVQEHFRIERTVDQLEGLYQELVESE
ncbi:MAG: glycosyltransferase family 4 protein [Caldilineaceae bacterium SB0668_bin_21]|nr:glycosyltransferase family 4 protein [Caldilineaceae bacterium SB0668_bin_21]MYC22287.1 glycosyltransferase family 4 protein [Caldilineaceae bacterium SB0662_bin_25]